jgi:ATP-dependent RNA helicase RhlE
MDGVRAMGYTTPTPIQQKAIPHVMQGRDVIGLAQTGTGKTAAFVLPILHRLAEGPRGLVRAAVISPTRELAEQTCDAFGELGQYTGLQSLPIYGGLNMSTQIDRLRHGVDIAVGCPGRLWDHLWRGTLDLSKIEVLVIDEADRMFDMGFLPSIRGILECILHERQTLLFSATMPKDIRRLVNEVLRDPVTVQIGRTRPAATVSHALYPVKQHLKTPLLTELLRRTKTESVLIFTRTKHRTERVAQHLKRAGFRATSLQGNLSQPRRQAALGIDVLQISHVINYDMPENIDSYTHRIGRTGRVNQSGDALTFVTGADKAMVDDLERVLDTRLERRTLQGFDYSSSASAPAPAAPAPAAPASRSGGAPRSQRSRRPARRWKERAARN